MTKTGLPIEDADYFVRLLQLPDGVRGAVRLNSDSTFTIFLNPDFCFEDQIDTYEHELLHIIRDDLFGDKDVVTLEWKRGA